MNKQKGLEQDARNALRYVLTSGVDGLGKKIGGDLKYGLENGLFEQKDVDVAQKKYDVSHRE